MTDNAREPPVLTLWQGDPLPPLPPSCGFSVAPGSWAALGTCGPAMAEATLRVAQAALLHGGDVAVFVHGAELLTEALESPYYSDAAGQVADRLGALADAAGARVALVVVVEPRGTVWAVHFVAGG